MDLSRHPPLLDISTMLFLLMIFEGSVGYSSCERRMRGESMNMGYTFGLNVVRKFQDFPLLSNWSPQNSYKHCEFWFGVKRHIVENFVVFKMIFFEKIFSII